MSGSGKTLACNMAQVFLEHPQWTPAGAWWTTRPFPRANGFIIAGTDQYDKTATPAADVHPEERGVFMGVGTGVLSLLRDDMQVRVVHINIGLSDQALLLI